VLGRFSLACKSRPNSGIGWVGKAVRLMKSSVHDGDIASMITFLDIITPDEHLPTTHIPHDRPWWKGQITPMGGRIIFELLSCRESGKYVRININDGITALPLDEFAVLVARKGREFGEFREVCRLGKEAEEGITFLHQ
jgi:acid phosphatase